MIIELGLADYEKAYSLQKELVAKRRLGEIDDSLIITEHPAVFTVGRSARSRNLRVGGDILSARGLRVLDVDRGGDVTFHGPGQLILYPIIDLRARSRDLHRYMRDLESVVISFLNGYGVIAERMAGRTGVWVGGRKIASIGVGAANWVTYHGMGVNIDVDLDYFSMIHPCGMEGVRMTSLSEILGGRVSTRDASGALISSFKRVFNWR